MTRAALAVVAVLACCHTPSFAQGTPIAMTANITSLDGLWIRDPTKGVEGHCGNTTDATIRISVSAPEVRFESRRLTGIIRLDGTETTVGGGNFSGAASATLDAGWLAVTTRRTRARGVGVSRDVYAVRDDELTIWRTFHFELPNGASSQNACDGRQALVYQRQRQP
jgi:hypothetical protein